MSSARAIRFLEKLTIPEGPMAGKRLKLAPFQKAFVKGALAPSIDVGCLSVGRGNAKTALSSGLALAALLGEIDPQPRRFIPLVARSRDQASIAFNFAEGFSRSLPDDVQKRLKFRRSPRLEIQYESDNGPHILRALAADGKNALGSGPTFILMDERGHWPDDKGDALEHALLSGCGKRGGRALIISTSASSDAHAFSRWLDNDIDGVYRQEHRPAPDLPVDDLPSLLIANPGAEYGVGASLEWLQAQARRAIERGGSALNDFRLFNRNERVSSENRDVLLTTDQWLSCEVSELPTRQGPVSSGSILGVPHP